jgi:hypothetical protein
MTARILVCIAFVAATAAAEVKPRRVTVKVVEIAGGRAYLEPGQAAGLRRGQDVRIGGDGYRVVDVTSKHAAVDDPRGKLRVGATGEATAAPGEEAGARATPAPLARFTGQWKDVVPPATGKKPKPVPLGRARDQGPVSLTLVEHGMVVLPADGGSLVAGELGARLSFEPWRDERIGFDADASALLWAGDGLAGDSSARPPVRVRELRLRWGDRVDPWVSLGRLRWAAATLGPLDGGRVAVPVGGGVTVAAFGGVLPDAVTGKPNTDVARFGGEVLVDLRGVDGHPRASLTAIGSTFGGGIDERRLAATVDLAPGPVTVSAYAEASLFDADNPWGARTVELTAAGVDVSVRDGGWHAGVRGDFLEPERSRYLASVLPPSWLCTAKVTPPGTAVEPCAGGLEARAVGVASAGVEVDAFTLDLGASAMHGFGDGELDTVSGFAVGRALRLWGRGRVELEGDATHAPFANIGGGRIAVGALLPGDVVDLSLHYRASVLSYVAALDTIVEHRAGADVELFPGASLDIVLGGEYTASSEYRALTILTTVVWRSLP